MEQHDFSRVEQMSDAELVRWSVIFHHMAAIEDHLRDGRLSSITWQPSRTTCER